MISIIGAGKWGKALYQGISMHNACSISSATKRPGFTQLDTAFKSKYLLFVISTQDTASWLSENYQANEHKVLIASKGIDTKSCLFLDELYSRYINPSDICFLSGPSFASEFASGLPCALVISGQNELLCKDFASFFPKEYVKTYISSDYKGSLIAGAYKNVLAIACGISDALEYGQNARASLMARGLIEMQRFGEAYGAKESTFLGLSGAGDLFLTASSSLSRNYRTGYALGKGIKLDCVLASLGEVAEGVQTAKAIVKMAASKGIYTPIATEVAKIIQGKEVSKSVKDLLNHN